MRARNMQSLTDAVKRRHPGVVVYGKGDEAHALRTSDHNEDDTSGVRAAQSDADSNPEHRAIDIMLGAAFTRAQAYALIADLLADPTARARLFYILFNGWRWSRSTGWARVEFDGDPHDDHIHISGWAADDENAAGWPAVEGDDMTPDEHNDLVALASRFLGVLLLDPTKVNSRVVPAGQLKDVPLIATIKQLVTDVAELKARPPVQPAPVDAAALKAVLLDPEVLAAVGKAMVDATRAEYND